MSAAPAACGAGEPAMSDILERPVSLPSGNALFGSDVVAETLRDLDIPYIALNPGASYRGLHDSIVNHIGNAAPQMLLCLHEETAVAIAHGYAKVTGKADGRGGAFQCRTVPRHHGDLQRLVRPHAGAGAGRHRAGRRRQAPAVDRLDPHRARPGRDRAPLHQVGRPASLAGGGARSRYCAADWLANTAPQGPVYINLDAEHAGGAADRAARRRSIAHASCRRSQPRAGTRPGARRPPRCCRRRRPGDDRRPCVAQRTAGKHRVALAEAIGAHVVSD